MKERPILFSAPMVLALLAGTKTQTRRIVKWRPSQVMCSLDCRGEAGPDHQWPDRGLGAGGYLKVGCKDGASQRVFCPHGEPGDRLWARETFGLHAPSDFTDWHKGSLRGKSCDDLAQWEVDYRADWKNDYEEAHWRPSIFMPRWASRITLEVTGVRVERLQDISEADAKAEGFEPYVHESWTVWDPVGEAHVSLSVEPTAADIAKHGYEDVRHIGPKVISTARERFLILWDTLNGAGAAEKNPWVWCIEFKRMTP